MINISELIQDPDFQQNFNVQRTIGDWVTGRFITTPTLIPFSGVIEPLNTRDMQQVPEGDTITGAINVYTNAPIYTTKLLLESGADGMLADEMIWQGERYKILTVQNYSDWGYYKATAVRKLGD